MSAPLTLRSSPEEVQSVSLEDRARLYARYLHRIARDTRSGVGCRLDVTQIDRVADLLDALATRAEAAA